MSDSSVSDPLIGSPLLQFQHLEDYRQIAIHLVEAADQGDRLAQVIRALGTDSAGPAVAEIEQILGTVGDPVFRAFIMTQCVQIGRAQFQHQPTVRRWISVLLDRMRVLEAQVRDPRLPRWRSVASLWVAEEMGHFSAIEEALLNAIRQFPLHSPARDNLHSRTALSLALGGEAWRLPRDLRPPVSAPHLIPSRWLGIAFIDAVEAGRVRRSGELLTEIGRAERDCPDLALTFRWYQGLLYVVDAVLAGKQPESRPLAAAAAALNEDNMPKARGNRKVRMGLAKRLEEFAQVARGEGESLRLQAPEVRAHVRTGTSLVAFTPIRAALQRRDRAQAWSLLEQRRAARPETFVDALFRARCLMLDGDAVGAHQEFIDSWTRAERVDALGRLEFELRLASELDPLALARMARGPRPRPLATEPTPVGSAIIGVSEPTSQLRSLIQRFAPSDLPVLITGATGTGKDLVARALHAQSPRAGRPLVTLNCSAFNDTLIESELFGHVRGAFSGADQERAGLAAEAADGTLFLDEIGDASPHFQALLLRLLENGEYRPVGANRVLSASCRVIAATNADLDGLVAAGRFRQDLWYRLRRLEINLAPLADRPEDIVPIALCALDPSGDHRVGISEALALHLRAQPWPGNVRQLRNELERMRIFHPDLDLYDLPHFLRAQAQPSTPTPRSNPRIADPERVPTADEDGVGAAAWRRRDRLRLLFIRHQRLRRKDVCQLLGITGNTAAADLQALCAEGLIEKVTPSRAPGTFHYVWIGGDGDPRRGSTGS